MEERGRSILAGGFLCATLAAALIVPVGGRAGTNTWTCGGPDGGGISCLAVDPSSPDILYAGVSQQAGPSFGIFKSTDGGQGWQEMNTGYANLSAKAIAVDPKNTGTIYALTTETAAQVIKSTDGGATWTQAGNGLPSQVYYLALDPLNSGILYASAFSGGVYKTTDGGATWNCILSDPGDWTGGPVAVDPTDPQVVYASSGCQATCASLFKSKDGGTTWDPIGNGLPLFACSALLVDPSTPTTLYASEGGVCCTPVLRSSDGGATWTAASTGLEGLTVNPLAADPSHPGTLYAGTVEKGLFKSTDSATSWAPVGSGIPDPWLWSLAVHPSDGHTLYAGTSLGGVFKSLDAGATWVQASGGLHHASVYAVAADPRNPGTAYAMARYCGVFESGTGGTSWTSISTGITDFNLTVLAVDPVNSGTFYAATENGSVFKSTDAGATWNPASSGLPTNPVIGLAISESDPSTLYAGTNGVGVYKSTDGATTWNTASSGLTDSVVTAIAVDPHDPATVYAGTAAAGLFKTTDGGSRWQLEDGLPSGCTVAGLAVNPQQNSTVFASMPYCGVYKTTDGGATWSPANTGLTSLSTDPLAMSQADPSRLYVGTNDGLFRTRDGGEHWITMAGPSAYFTAASLAVDGSLPPTVYAGGYQSSVWAYTDACTAITLMPAALPDGTLGASYGQPFSASGGTSPYSFAVTAGSLPGGLSLGSGGLLSGTPATTGAFSFTVTATDANGCSGSQAYTLTIAPADCPSISLSPARLPGGSVGTSYSQTFSASGGTAPYAYAVVSGVLPSGLGLGPDGALSGTPAAAGSFGFTVGATDSHQCTGSNAYTVTIGGNCAAIAFSPSSLPNAAVGAVYSQTITASGGSAPYSYAVASGALPAGLDLAPDGTLAGTPTIAGSFAFTVTVTDRNACSASQAYSVTVVNPPVITAVSKKTGPFRLVVAGSNFHAGATATIGTTAWTNVVVKSGSELAIKGGAGLKALFPKSTPVPVTITNHDDGGVSQTVLFTR